MMHIHCCRHAAMTVSLMNKEVGCVSWVGPHSGVPVFTLGAMSYMINWKKLSKGKHY